MDEKARKAEELMEERARTRGPNGHKQIMTEEPVGERPAESVDLKPCTVCGQVTTGDICAFCKLADQIKRHAVPPDADRVVE